jgi:hypothetical protein
VYAVYFQGGRHNLCILTPGRKAQSTQYTRSGKGPVYAV